MSNRIYNFSPGPAILPEPVLQEVQEALWDLDGTGIGVLEHSHRSNTIECVLREAVADCRTLANIAQEYAIIFIQGGASLQFTMLPANFLRDKGTADYLDTGIWARKAIVEAQHYGQVHIAATSEKNNYSRIPEMGKTTYSPAPDFVHFTSNNTIFGTQWSQEPVFPNTTWLACDASSDLLSRPIDIRRYGLLYAGAQKNLGPAGVTLVVIRRDLVDQSVRKLPTMLRYATYTKHNSLYNTPSVFGVYVVGRVFKWILKKGGLNSLARLNLQKARLIYDVIDRNTFYKGIAHEKSRSMMNVTFRTPNPSLDEAFAREATSNGLEGLKGHRSVGGLRASIYNAFPVTGCRALATFMEDFAARRG